MFTNSHNEKTIQSTVLIPNVPRSGQKFRERSQAIERVF